MNLPQILLHAPLAAALPDHPHWLDVISFQFNGLIVVFLALGLIWGMLELMSLIFRRAERKPVQAPSIAPIAIIPSGVTLEQVAAISAAIEITLGVPHRIEAIVPAEPALDWAHEGRRQIFASHKTR